MKVLHGFADFVFHVCVVVIAIAFGLAAVAAMICGAGVLIAVEVFKLMTGYKQ